MSSTTPSATKNSASLDRLQVENGKSWSCGRDNAICLICWRSGSVNFGGRPPAYFGASESNPSALKLWITSRTRSSDVNAIRAIAGDVHRLRRPQHDLRSTPPHHRPRTPSHDPEQLVALHRREVSNLHTFSHPPMKTDPTAQVVDAPPPTLPVTALAAAAAPPPRSRDCTSRRSTNSRLTDARGPRRETSWKYPRTTGITSRRRVRYRRVDVVPFTGLALVRCPVTVRELAPPPQVAHRRTCDVPWTAFARWASGERIESGR